MRFELPTYRCFSIYSQSASLFHYPARFSGVWRVALVVLALMLWQLPTAVADEPMAARNGMVVSSEARASQAGVEILREGGNAVDAAVAVGFTLAVTYPFAGNIGGGGFMLIRMASGRSTVVDYREEAPGAASRGMYLDSHGNIIPDASIVGARAVGVPGTVAGLALAEQKYGKLGLARVMAPAIRIAGKGFPVGYWLSQSLLDHQPLLSKFPNSRAIYLHGGEPYQPGDIFKQPELAHTLREIARRGPTAFYRGDIARDIVETETRLGGIMTLADLAHYQANLRPLLQGRFHGYTILTVPPPSSGGVALIEMLNILDPLNLGEPDSYNAMRLIIEAQRRAYADRSRYLGDADFVSVPVGGLDSPAYAAKLRQEILTSKPDAPVAAGQPAGYESSNTTHFSVVDAAGDAVSNTYTLNNGYGSGVTVDHAGFLLNDEMDDFTSKPGAPNMFGLIQGEANAIAPYKRPLSSMTPTLVLENNAPRLVLGAPGGGTIINTVLEVMLNALVYKMDILRAVTEPRFHNQWMPDKVFLERNGFSADTVEKLRAAGYKIEWVDRMGECEAIEVDPKTGWRFGAADPRGSGEAVGN
ncbi:MAG TPA: gamma-glutamyltransferase [Terriglobia bacterium]|nr:gamma-glutamyltransferase [Terriglobia bacterium]